MPPKAAVAPASGCSQPTHSLAHGTHFAVGPADESSVSYRRDADDEGTTLVVGLTDSETAIVRAMIVHCEAIVGSVIVGSEVAAVNMILRRMVVDHDVTVSGGYDEGRRDPTVTMGGAFAVGDMILLY